jgi:hypothetical protein
LKDCDFLAKPRGARSLIFEWRGGDGFDHGSFRKGKLEQSCDDRPYLALFWDAAAASEAMIERAVKTFPSERFAGLSISAVETYRGRVNIR